MPRAWTAVLLSAGLAASAAVYTYRLDSVPAYLTLDEAHFAIHATSLAETGRNLNGQILPPLISLEDPEGEPYILPWGTTYYLPFGMYLIAGALQVLPLNEATVRTPSALLGGAINVALIFAVALALFRSRTAAFASAAVLALSPANVIISRQALDSVCQPPFVLGALWCLATYIRKPDPRLALEAGIILGCGIYAYITSIVFMPFYLALFWFIGWRAGVLERRAVACSIAGFAAALLPMALWLAAHPDAARSLQLQYNRADPGSATLMQTLQSGGAGAALAETIRVYWSYFDPSFLFVQGGNARNLSTGEIGVFLYPVAVLAPLGLYHLREHRLARLLIVIGLLTAPLPAVIKGAPYAIQRASGLLIYVSLVAGAGLAYAAMSARLLARAAAAALVVFMAWQFTSFYRDYHGRYRLGSAHAYDPTAFREVAESIIRIDAEAAVQAVYMPVNFYDSSAKWRFYTNKHDRPALWRRTTYYDGLTALAPAPLDSVAVVPVANGNSLDGWETIAIVKSVTDEPTATIIRRKR
jgi:4-amino-4-deoxy-L-arabinose transferase-like glycosyltransferase